MRRTSSRCSTTRMPPTARSGSWEMLRRRFCLWLILSGTGLYFFANIQRVAIPGAIFDLLQEDLHLSAPGVTALGSVFMYVYALNQLTIGVLINNAGSMNDSFRLSQDGYEMTVAVNYIGTAALTLSLLPLMHSGSRIINTLSCTYRIGQVGPGWTEISR